MPRQNSLPSVLSLQRGTIVTDGAMFSVLPGDKLTPVRVIRHGIRGVLLEKGKDSVSNPQRTESAKTAPTAIGLSVQFNWRALPAQNLLFACSDVAYREKISTFIGEAFKIGVLEFDEVCRRYARNILNGRWLWRNRMLGEVSVTAKVGEREFKSLGSNLKGFENFTEDETNLALIIAQSLTSGAGGEVIRVDGRVMFGFAGAVEVFPSQNMVTSKPSGFARSLYKTNPIARKELQGILATANNSGEFAGEFAADVIDMGEAALRDQKIGNAIRTIDTWYDGFDKQQQIIAIEPNGASLDANEIFRSGTQNANAKSLLERIETFREPQTCFDPRKAFLIALMVRGGVFSNSKKDGGAA